MPKDVPHAVFGEERFKMELVVSFQINNTKSNYNMIEWKTDFKEKEWKKTKEKISLMYFIS